MCKATDEVMQYVEKSHSALSAVISNLMGDLSKRIEKLEKRQESTEKVAREVRDALHRVAERL